MNEVPIFIPSKGRPQCPTAARLLADNLEPIIVVEPQEREAYAKAGFKNFLVLSESNKGIAFVRNYIKYWASVNDHPWFWMLDDDIKQFYRVDQRRNVKTETTRVLAEAHAMFRELPNLAIGALEYQQFSWSTPDNKPLALNSYCDVAVCINTKRTEHIEYDAAVVGKEDRDFVLQCLSRGMLAARCRRLAFSAPKNGSNAGGLKEMFYDLAGREEKAVDLLAAKWPAHVTKVVKPDGRIDAKIKWANFKVDLVV